MSRPNHAPFHFAARVRDKEDARRRDRERLRRGEVTPEQLKRANESFAFAPERVRADLTCDPFAGAVTRADLQRAREPAGARKPKLLLDVDGVLLPVRRRDGSEPCADDARFRPVRVDGLRGHVATWLLEGAPALADRFDIVWATSWEDRANGELTDLFGWGRRPWLGIFQGMRAGRSRVDVVSQAIGDDEPLVWCDDQGVGEVARRWAAARRAPTLLIRPRPHRGLGPRHLARILAFGAAHRDG